MTTISTIPSFSLSGFLARRWTRWRTARAVEGLTIRIDVVRAFASTNPADGQGLAARIVQLASEHTGGSLQEKTGTIAAHVLSGWRSDRADLSSCLNTAIIDALSPSKPVIEQPTRIDPKPVMELPRRIDPDLERRTASLALLRKQVAEWAKIEEEKRKTLLCSLLFVNGDGTALTDEDLEALIKNPETDEYLEALIQNPETELPPISEKSMRSLELIQFPGELSVLSERQLESLLDQFERKLFQPIPKEPSPPETGHDYFYDHLLYVEYLEDLKKYEDLKLLHPKQLQDAIDSAVAFNDDLRRRIVTATAREERTVQAIEART